MIFGFSIVEVGVLFFAIAGFLFSFVNYCRTGNLKQYANDIKFILKESEDMKYKTSDQREKAQQTFTPYKNEYVYDERNNTLEATGEQIDVQKLINSVLPTALESILQKYLNNQAVAISPEDKVIVDYSDLRDDLEMRTDYINVAEDYREKFGLSADMTHEEIYQFMDKKAKELKEFIAGSTKKSEVKNDET